MKRETLDRLNEAREAGRAVVLATDLSSGETRLIDAEAGANYDFCGADIENDVLAALRNNRSAIMETPKGDIFLNVFNPPLKLVIVGAVHIAQALIPIAAALSYNITVIDPRGAFADDQRFGGLYVSPDWPDEALEKIDIDARTAVVTLTHDPKLDDAALAVALKSDAFYIGSLGSRKTHAARLERLKRLEFGEESLARIHGPVGLNIGARSAAEIAVSIMAQITQVLNGQAA